MILLETREILAAVRRSLESNVLPELADGFARVQVIAALRALDEVVDRMEHGDPLERVNERLERDLSALASDLPEESAALAAAIGEMLAGAARIPDPRERNRVVGERLTDLLAGEDPATGRLRHLLEMESARTAGDDAAWMCQEAIESLQ